MTCPTISENQAVEDLLETILKKLESRDFDLPPLPQVASEVLVLSSNPYTNATKLANLIQQDPVLTAKIFQSANSLAYGSPRNIESLPQAIAWLGLNHLAGTAFGLSMQSRVFQTKGYEQEVKSLWKHALATGFFGKTLADHLGQNADLAFLCGLLHAIGKPFVVHTVIQSRKTSDPHLSWSAILTLMKESYIEVGRHLAEAWAFPESVKEAIALHEDHAYHLATSPERVAPITCLASKLASHLLDPEHPTHEAILAHPVGRHLQLTQEDIQAFLDLKNSIKAKVESMLL